MRQSRPIARGPVESMSQVKRNVFCRSYGRCLDQAIMKKWSGFSCERCHAFEREKMDMKDWCRELDNCMVLSEVCEA